MKSLCHIKDRLRDIRFSKHIRIFALTRDNENNVVYVVTETIIINEKVTLYFGYPCWLDL